MPQTELGKKVKGWSNSSKEELKGDLQKLTKVPLGVLRSVIHEIARTYPACNPSELAAFEAEQHGLSNPTELSDSLSVWTYIWDNLDGESPHAVANDLVELGLSSEPAARLLSELMTEVEPLRETAMAASRYVKIGAPLFVSLRGTVDIRCRFHKRAEDFSFL